MFEPMPMQQQQFGAMSGSNAGKGTAASVANALVAQLGKKKEGLPSVGNPGGTPPIGEGMSSESMSGPSTYTALGNTSAFDDSAPAPAQMDFSKYLDAASPAISQTPTAQFTDSGNMFQAANMQNPLGTFGTMPASKSHVPEALGILASLYGAK